MRCCERLYRPENIIGYTGDTNNNPTVYFVTESRDENGNLKLKDLVRGAQVLFLNGHITQQHASADNVGRELVKESYYYSITNVWWATIDGFDGDNNAIMPPPDEVRMFRDCVKRGRPFGDFEWVDSTVKQLGLRPTVRPRGRPRVRTRPRSTETSPDPFYFSLTPFTSPVATEPRFRLASNA
jgi:hypothetical protein